VVEQSRRTPASSRAVAQLAPIRARTAQFQVRLSSMSRIQASRAPILLSSRKIALSPMRLACDSRSRPATICESLRRPRRVSYFGPPLQTKRQISHASLGGQRMKEAIASIESCPIKGGKPHRFSGVCSTSLFGFEPNRHHLPYLALCVPQFVWIPFEQPE